jgi:hypothetical protein
MSEHTPKPKFNRRHPHKAIIACGPRLIHILACDSWTAVRPVLGRSTTVRGTSVGDSKQSSIVVPEGIRKLTGGQRNCSAEFYSAVSPSFTRQPSERGLSSPKPSPVREGTASRLQVCDTAELELCATLHPGPKPQYLGTAGSISSDQARMPPLTFFSLVNPFLRKNSSACIERQPDLQWI